VRQIREILEKEEVQSEVKVYEGMVHGVARTGDWQNDKEKEAIDQAEKQGLKWFEKYMGRCGRNDCLTVAMNSTEYCNEKLERFQGYE
jgi:hypothetical protein